MGKFWETRGGVGKMVCWSTKVAISLKRVQIEEKLLWGPIGISNALNPMWHHPLVPYPKIGVRTPTKTPIAIISETGKAMNFKFGLNRVHPNKSL